MVQGPLAPASLRANESYVRFHGQQVGSGMKRFICAAEQKAAERGSGCQSWQFFSEVRSESKVGASSVVDRAPTQAPLCDVSWHPLIRCGISGCFCTVQGIKSALIASRSTTLAPEPELSPFLFHYGCLTVQSVSAAIQLVYS